MATSRGRSEVKRFMAQLPAELTRKVLRGAARAGATVVLEEAKDRVTSEEVRNGLVMKARSEGSHIVVKISVKPGWARSLGTWLEWGTDPHVISIADDRDRQGMTIGRINKVQKAGTLVIGGSPVGQVVHHPGARPHPFLRVSLDLKERAAIAAAQSYINSRVRPSGIVGTSELEGDDA